MDKHRCIFCFSPNVGEEKWVGLNEPTLVWADPENCMPFRCKDCGEDLERRDILAPGEPWHEGKVKIGDNTWVTKAEIADMRRRGDHPEPEAKGRLIDLIIMDDIENDPGAKLTVEEYWKWFSSHYLSGMAAKENHERTATEAMLHEQQRNFDAWCAGVAPTDRTADPHRRPSHAEYLRNQEREGGERLRPDRGSIRQRDTGVGGPWPVPKGYRLGEEHIDRASREGQ